MSGTVLMSVILEGMTATPTDEALMQRYREDDLSAFAELYRRHGKGLYQFIAWRSPRREWVEEIVQDSWAAMHEARARYEPIASFKTWLYQIARNRLIDLLRYKEAKLASDMGEEPVSVFERLADQAGEVASPEHILEKKQQLKALHEAIRELPVEQKEVLILQQFNAMSMEEIAQITGTPVETVKSRLRYAMQKLRSKLAPPTASLSGERA
jgi:RNA polymerase sigma factor (sigma-70 family)